MFPVSPHPLEARERRKQPLKTSTMRGGETLEFESLPQNKKQAILPTPHHKGTSLR